MRTNCGIGGFGSCYNKLHLISQKTDGNGMAPYRTRSICGVEARSKALFGDNWYSDYRKACEVFVGYYKGEACLNCMRYAKYYLTRISGDYRLLEEIFFLTRPAVAGSGSASSWRGRHKSGLNDFNEL